MSPICSEMCSTYESYMERLRQDGILITSGISAREELYVSPKEAPVDDHLATSSFDGLTPPPDDEDKKLEDKSMTPAQLLQLSIRKRRALDKCKERPLDRELFLASTITRLCSEIGRARAERKRQRRFARQNNLENEQLHHGKKPCVAQSNENSSGQRVATSKNFTDAAMFAISDDAI